MAWHFWLIIFIFVILICIIIIYGTHGDTHVFMPIAIETAGQVLATNRLFIPLKTSADASPSLQRNHLKLSYLFKRILVAIQRGTAVSFMRMFDDD